MLQVLWGLGGMALVLVLALLVSVNRRGIRLRPVVLALLVQVVFAVLVLYVPVGQQVLGTLARGVQAIIDSSKEGIDFLFGPILPDEGTLFAFQVLPVIVFFAALTAVLYHLGLMQLLTRLLGGGLAKLLGTTQPESLNAAANIFVGQTEAPLVIKPYVARMSPSELFAVMSGGLTTVAGSVLVGYSLLGAELDYLIAASFMAAPAGLLMAKIIVPAGSLPELAPATGDEVAAPPERTSAQQAGLAARIAAAFRRGGRRGASHAGASELASRDGGAPRDDARQPRHDESPAATRKTEDASETEEAPPVNVIDAASRGASDGLDLALNVGAMLLAFISLIALGNLILGAVGGLFGADDLTIENLLGYVFSPIMAAVGVPLGEAVEAGSFLGQKVVLNEFVAFADFAPRAEEFSAKAQAVITFTLTGFANLGSLAILLGGLGGIAPGQRGAIARLGLRAVAAGTLGNLMSAAIAGVLIG